MAKTTIEKIESVKAEIAKLENRKKELMQEQKKKERQNRTNRLCRRAGLLESMMPGTIALTDEQFKTFLEKTITSEQGRRILEGLAGQDADTAAPNPAEPAQATAADLSSWRGGGARVPG